MGLLVLLWFKTTHFG